VPPSLEPAHSNKKTEGGGGWWGEQCKNLKENQLSRKQKDVFFSVLSLVIAQTCGGGSQLLQQIISSRNNDFFLF